MRAAPKKTNLYQLLENLQNVGKANEGTRYYQES